ncbi:YceI family protein, partial [Corynebacterium macginleyi]|uniref:YceI family protein n=1 Tax=Corynebacterium macginleyi TaxID=38290 RepID=UPI002D7FBCFA
SWKEREYPVGNKPSTRWPWPFPTASTNTYKPNPTHKQLDTLGFEAQTKINRKDFGIDFNAPLKTGGVLVSEDIKIELEISAIKQ